MNSGPIHGNRRSSSLWNLGWAIIGAFLAIWNIVDLVTAFSVGAIDFPRGRSPAVYAVAPIKFVFIVGTKVMMIAIGLALVAAGIISLLRRQAAHPSPGKGKSDRL